MEWHFDYSADDLAAAANDLVRDKAGKAHPSDPETALEGEGGTPELDSYRLGVLRFVTRDAAAAGTPESGDSGGLSFSPWIEGVLKGDRNRYAADPPLRTLVLTAIALRLKIQDDIENAAKTKQALSETLAADLKLAARTIDELQAHVASSGRESDPMAKEVLRLKFSLFLHQEKLQDYLKLSQDDAPGKGAGQRPRVREREPGPGSRRVKTDSLRKPATAQKTTATGPETGAAASGPMLQGEGERPGIFRRIRRALSFVGIAPILIVLAACFFMVLHYTGRETPVNTGREQQQQPTSPYQQEIKFKSARCDDKTFFGVVTGQWKSLKPAQKMEALMALRKKLLKDGIQAGILTTDSGEKTASWDLEQASLNE
jgi:hypothetical protein